MTDKSQTHNPSSEITLGLTSTATISSRAYFSTYYLCASKHFSKIAGEIEDNHEGKSQFDLEHRAFVMNSILSAAAFLEAVINEFYQNAHDVPKHYEGILAPEVITNLSSFWAKTEHSNKKNIPTLKKYQKALRYANKEVFNEKESIFKDIKLIIQIRHYLTHYKPMTMDEKHKHPLDDDLRNRFEPSKMMEDSGNNFFPDKALGAGCTEWCLKSVKNFTDEFFKRMGIKPNYQVVDMDKLAGKK